MNLNLRKKAAPPGPTYTLYVLINDINLTDYYEEVRHADIEMKKMFPDHVSTEIPVETSSFPQVDLNTVWDALKENGLFLVKIGPTSEFNQIRLEIKPESSIEGIIGDYNTTQQVLNSFGLPYTIQILEHTYKYIPGTKIPAEQVEEVLNDPNAPRLWRNAAKILNMMYQSEGAMTFEEITRTLLDTSPDPQEALSWMTFNDIIFREPTTNDITDKVLSGDYNVTDTDLKSSFDLPSNLPEGMANKLNLRKYSELVDQYGNPIVLEEEEEEPQSLWHRMRQKNKKPKEYVTDIAPGPMGQYPYYETPKPGAQRFWEWLDKIVQAWPTQAMRITVRKQGLNFV